MFSNSSHSVGRVRTGSAVSGPVRPPLDVLAVTGVDRWGTWGTRSPTFQRGGNCGIGIVPSTFQFRNIAGHVA